MVLRHQVRKPGVSHTVRKLDHCQVRGHRSRVRAWLSLITAVRKTKTNGRMKNAAAMRPRECTAIQLSAFLRRAVRRARMSDVALLSRTGVVRVASVMSDQS